MRRLSIEAKVGIFILVCVLVLAYMTLTVGKYRIGKPEGIVIYTVFDNVAGLDLKSPVRMAGVEIGKVEDITLADGKARVTLRIDPQVALRRGGTASLRATGMLGDKYLEIEQGPPDASVIKEGESIPQSGVSADFNRLIAQTTKVAEDLGKLTSALGEVLGTEEGKASLKDILANLRDLSDNLNRTVKENRKPLGETLENFRAFSASLRKEGPDLLVRMREVADDLEAILTENRVGVKETVENVRRASAKLETTLESVNRVTTRLDKGEGVLGKLMTDDTLYTSITESVSSIRDYLDTYNRLRLFVGFRSEYLTDSENSKSYFSLTLEPRENKYYLLEIMNDPFGQVTETETRTVVTNATTDERTVKETKTEDKLKFSAQFGRRFGNLGLRIGLMESTFGAGADYYLLDGDLRLTLDAWNFGSKEEDNKRLHLKATAAYSFFKYLFLNVGYDNFLNPERDSFFVGGGLRFEDEDLKYLSGAIPLSTR